MPAAKPVAFPEASIDMMDGSPTLQFPPREMLLSSTTCPTQTFGGPVMASGSGFTVISFVVEHPVGMP